MPHLVLVAVANRSLQDNLRLPNASDRLPAPTEVYRRWQGMDAATRMDRAHPFSELAPLPAQLADVDRLSVVIIGPDDKEEAALPCEDVLLDRAALREDGTPFTYLDYIQEYCTAAFPGLRPSVLLSGLSGYRLKNGGEEPASLQAVVMDLAARIDATFAGSPGVRVVANPMGGVRYAVEGLRFAADELGWDVAYMNHQPVKTIGRTSPLSSLAHLWGAARSLVSEFETALPGGGSREDANRCVTQAEGLGALAFVVPREVQGRYHVEMSELGGALIRKRGGEGRPVYSATQRLLGRRHDQESQRLAGRLQQLLERWARSDLFGSNQVSELVTHTESHCEAVDRNVASVVAPLLEDGTLTPQDVFNLAVAAWLHDWGHSGAAFSLDLRLATIRDPGDIRDVHGLLSAERIRELRGPSGLAPAETTVPALIAAHHQGWTSIGEAPPGDRTPACLASLRNSDLTLAIELESAHRNNAIDGEEMARLPLLIALFRVCDAADVGLHRAFYKDVLWERAMDEIMLYGWNQLRQSEGWGAYLEELRRTAKDLLEGKGDPAGLQVGVEVPGLPGTPKRHANDAIAQKIERWAKHCVEQVGYFDHHRTVLGVHLSMQKVASGWNLVPFVTPVDAKSASAAVLAVSEDVLREVGDLVEVRPDGKLEPRANSKQRHKAEVGALLAKAGIKVECARLA